MNNSHNKQGISVIEIVIVLVIIGVITGLMLPRMQDRNSDNNFNKDTSFFVENIGKAQSMATSSNSRSCATTVNERLEKVELLVISANRYQIIPYCKLIDNPSNIIPTPNPTYIMPFSTESSTITPSSIFASFFPDGTVVPGGVLTFTGIHTCQISISTTGVVTNTCPP